ncbi:MAG: 7-cyano-7-deazaguanine synthase [Candidatus Nanoarchaeia archaeon]|nr:7-cyano-7-deazaguanine synthase [Candidatus Nanoarchaeia archaeon]MDD5239235.1 7-cyano-7-deazaguanine synthase [Candidatus Nanoarchaeia archaeon]
MKAVCLLSGGIDSPVAAHMMLKKGIDVVLLNCSYGEKPAEKVLKLRNVLGKRITLYSADMTPCWKTFAEKLSRKHTCLFCKRMMYRLAKKLAKEIGADVLITGENMGQVASQTLVNMAVNDSAINMFVVRPLLAMDKQEIIKIAKGIGTYELSIHDAGCCPYVPNEPSTQAKIEFIESEEAKIDIKELLEKIEFKTAKKN